MENFKTILEMKSDLFKPKCATTNAVSRSFTNSAGRQAYHVGRVCDRRLPGHGREGIAIVKEYIASLANDEKTQALVNMVFRLLSRDAKARTLKASRIVQLRKGWPKIPVTHGSWRVCALSRRATGE